MKYPIYTVIVRRWNLKISKEKFSDKEEAERNFFYFVEGEGIRSVWLDIVSEHFFYDPKGLEFCCDNIKSWHG